MKQPIHGDELTIRYQGATVTARCDDVTEIPKCGPGAAKFTIVSKVIFQRDSQAVLVRGNDELPLRVERVTAMPHKRINIVSFFGVFDNAAPSVAAT